MSVERAGGILDPVVTVCVEVLVFVTHWKCLGKMIFFRVNLFGVFFFFDNNGNLYCGCFIFAVDLQQKDDFISYVYFRTCLRGYHVR